MNIQQYEILHLKNSDFNTILKYFFPTISIEKSFYVDLVFNKMFFLLLMLLLLIIVA